MMIHSISRAFAIGVSIFLSSVACASADATEYFPKLSASEKEDFVNWVNAHSSSYPRHSFMPSAGDQEDGAAIFWKINEDKLNVAVAVRADGWVGFGISEAGGMIGSDIALFKASDPSQVLDTHVVGDRTTPIKDDCQDWTLENARSSGENGWIIVEMSRLLDTKDTQDHALKNDADLWAPPTRIIAAWGNDDDISYHGKKNARSSVRLFANHPNGMTEMDVLLGKLEKGSDDYFDFTEDEFEIPAEDTTYQDLCRTAEDLNIELSEGQDVLTMTGVVPIISKETEQFVHHFVVWLARDCTEESYFTRSMVYAWAPGDKGFALPDDVGFPFLNGENNQAIHMQIHYNNPRLIPGMKDSSGLRLYYSNTERTHRAGMLETGDPHMALFGEEISDGLTKYSFTCPGACSSSMLAAGKRRIGANEETITILAEGLHMHASGVRMTNELIRDGKVVHESVADVFDFDQQGLHYEPQDSYEVLPGDSFRTTCYYKDGKKFGLSSSEEMCMAFILYYPAKETSFGQPWQCLHQPWDDFGTGCATELESTELNSVRELGRIFGEPSTQCDAEPLDTSADTPSRNDNFQVQEPGTSSAVGFGMAFFTPFASALIVGIVM